MTAQPGRKAGRPTLTAEQLSAARTAAQRAHDNYLRDNPHDYAGASRAQTDALAAALSALHGKGRWN